MTVRAASRRVDSSASDDLRLYLNQIGRTPLLTAKQEVDLAIKIRAGVDAEARLESITGGARSMPDAEARRLHRIAAVGRDAKRHLTEANLRLVVSNAKRYTGSGMALADLIQAGNLGLLRAVEKYDHTTGYRFSTYATHWIRQGVTRAIADQSRTIRIPVHMNEQVNKFRKASRQLTTVLGREPELAEIAEALEVDVDRAAQLEQMTHHIASLDNPVGEEGDTTLGDFCADDAAPSPVEEVEHGALRDDVAALLSELTERERRVVVMRFGLDGHEPRTLEEVGREFGLTRERIRQIECKTLVGLRKLARARDLSSYLAG